MREMKVLEQYWFEVNLWNKFGQNLYRDETWEDRPVMEQDDYILIMATEAQEEENRQRKLQNEAQAKAGRR